MYILISNYLPSRNILHEIQTYHLVGQIINGEHLVAQRPVQQKDGRPSRLVGGVHARVIVREQLLLEPIQALLLVQIVFRVELLHQIVAENQDGQDRLFLLAFRQLGRGPMLDLHLTLAKKLIGLGAAYKTKIH